jgi:hypothetical protein
MSSRIKNKVSSIIIKNDINILESGHSKNKHEISYNSNDSDFTYDPKAFNKNNIQSISKTKNKKTLLRLREGLSVLIELSKLLSSIKNLFNF